MNWYLWKLKFKLKFYQSRIKDAWIGLRHGGYQIHITDCWWYDLNIDATGVDSPGIRIGRDDLGRPLIYMHGLHIRREP